MKDAKVTNWLAKRGKFDHATLDVHIAQAHNGHAELLNVGVGIPDGEMTLLLGARIMMDHTYYSIY